jgi:putative intracellular protease/amidase
MGGLYQQAEDWNPLVVVDGLIITGQNPASSDGVAEALLKAIN